MKNITITVDDETHRKARVRAAELGTSVSALVKAYLQQLTDDPQPLPPGVREMPQAFAHAPHEKPAGPPYLVGGRWVYTRDGKPRRPGALRGKAGWTRDFEEWPDGFLDAMFGDDTPASDTWWKPANETPKPSDGE